MSIDNNDFDSLLKKKLYRDLLFRCALWVAVSATTGHFAMTSLGLAPLQYLDRVDNTLLPLANIFGAFSLLLCILALMLKDLEATLTEEKYISATRGYLGGAVRRIAGDLSLWTLGALTTVFSAFIISIFQVTIKPAEYAAIIILMLTFITMIFLVAITNIYVRRAGPTPITETIKNPIYIAAGYLFALAVLIGSLFKVTA